MGNLIGVAITFSEITAFVFIADTFFSRKKHRVCFYAVFLITIFSIVCSASLLTNTAPLWRMIATVVLVFTAFMITYVGSPTYKLFVCIGFFILLSTIDYLVISVCMIVFSYSFNSVIQHRAIYLLVAFVAKLILLVITTIIKKIFRKAKSKNKTATPFLWALMIIPAFSILNIIVIIDNAIRNNNLYPSIPFEIVGYLLCNIIVFLMSDKIENEQQLIIKNALLKQEINKNFDNTKALEKSYDKHRKLTHEFFNQMRTLQGLHNSKAYAEATNFINEIMSEFAGNKQFINTNNKLIDVVLNQKYEEALKNGLNIIFLVEDLSDLFIKDADIVTLLSNILDNAIEAAVKSENGNSIRVKAAYDINTSFIISVRNNSNTVHIKHNQIESTKANISEHGFGLSNVSHIIKQYKGNFALHYSEGWFQFTAIIPQLHRSSGINNVIQENLLNI